MRSSAARVETAAQLHRSDKADLQHLMPKGRCHLTLILNINIIIFLSYRAFTWVYQASLAYDVAAVGEQVVHCPVELVAANIARKPIQLGTRRLVSLLHFAVDVQKSRIF